MQLNLRKLLSSVAAAALLDLNAVEGIKGIVNEASPPRSVDGFLCGVDKLHYSRNNVEIVNHWNGNTEQCETTKKF